MKAVDFVYWLQGYFELRNETGGLTEKQTQIIKNHLDMVFVHDIDPKLGDAIHQAKLDEAHQGKENETGNKPHVRPWNSNTLIKC